MVITDSEWPEILILVDRETWSFSPHSSFQLHFLISSSLYLALLLFFHLILLCVCHLMIGKQLSPYLQIIYESFGERASTPWMKHPNESRPHPSTSSPFKKMNKELNCLLLVKAKRSCMFSLLPHSFLWNSWASLLPCPGVPSNVHPP